MDTCSTFHPDFGEHHKLYGAQSQTLPSYASHRAQPLHIKNLVASLRAAGRTVAVLYADSFVDEEYRKNDTSNIIIAVRLVCIPV